MTINSPTVNLGSTSTTVVNVGSTALTTLNLGSAATGSLTTTVGGANLASPTTVQSGTGGLILSSTATHASAINLNVIGANGGILLNANGTGKVTVGGSNPTVSPAAGGSFTLGDNTGAAQTTLRSGTGGTNVSSTATTSSSINFQVGGVNGGILLAPNGTGIVTVGGSAPTVSPVAGANFILGDNTTGAHRR